jgi:hypothetical protein
MINIAAANANVLAVNDDTIAIPGHGAIGSKTQPVAFRDMLVGSRENVAKLKQAGRSADETIAGNPTVQMGPVFGQFVISPAVSIRLFYEGV